MKIIEQLLEILKDNHGEYAFTFVKSKIDSLKMHDLFQNFPRILIHIEGETVFSLDNQERVLKKPEVIIIGQGCKSHWTTDSSAKVLEVIFAVDELVIESSYKGKVLSEFAPHSSNTVYEELKAINKSLILDDFKDLNQPYKLPQVFYYLTLCHKALKESAKQKFKKSFSKKRFKFREIQTYINQNMDKSLSREELTQRFRINVNTFSNLFQFWENSSFKQYVIEMKLTEARNYLFQNDISIADLSKKYGFNSPDHFIYTFKKHFYYSPLKLKKLLSKPNSLSQLRELYRLDGFEYAKEEQNQVFSYTEGSPQLCYVINATGNKLNFYWLNEVGKKVKLDEMAPHKRLRCNTFEGQCFVGDDNIQKPRTFKIPSYKSQILFY
ncbi:MAG: AraC family transcriptional regulator [Lentisphaerales bacterium]|nr:AraC family transcriptional regulator [Lentisphaerales bacterium]